VSKRRSRSFRQSLAKQAIYAVPTGAPLTILSLLPVQLQHLAKNARFDLKTNVDMNITNYSTNSVKAVCIPFPDDEYAVFTVLSIIINLLTCPLVIFLNALFITAMRKKRRLQTMHNILLASMAGTDLAVGIGSQPVFVSQEIFLVAGGSLSVYCKFFTIQRATTSCLCLLSLLHLALIAVERFVAMKYSLRYDSIVTKFRLTAAVAYCWLIMIFYWVTWLFYKPLIPPPVLVIACFLLMVYCHLSVYFICRRHVLQIKSEQVSTDATSKFLEERKAWKTTTIIIAGVVVSYSPGIISIIALRNSPFPMLQRLSFSSQPFYFSCFLLNSLLNPIIYCWRIKVIRQAMLQLLRKQNI